MTYNFSTKYGTSDHTAAVSRGHEPGQKSYLQSGTLKSGFSTPTFSRSNPDSNVFTCSIETQSILNCSFYKKNPSLTAILEEFHYHLLFPTETIEKYV